MKTFTYSKIGNFYKHDMPCSELQKVAEVTRPCILNYYGLKFTTEHDKVRIDNAIINCLVYLEVGILKQHYNHHVLLLDI